MLKPFVTMCFWLMVFWLGLSAVSISIGQSQPLPADIRAADLDMCDDQPCVLGVIPGRTLWRDAQELLSIQTGSDIQEKSIMVPVEPGAEAFMYRSINGTAVGPVYVNYEEPMVLGWVLAKFGKPCGISLYVRADMATLRYPFVLVNLQLKADDSHIRIDMPVRTLHFRDSSYRSEVQPDLCYDNITDGARNRQWKGFAPVWDYLTTAP